MLATRSKTKSKLKSAKPKTITLSDEDINSDSDCHIIDFKTRRSPKKQNSKKSNKIIYSSDDEENDSEYEIIEVLNRRCRKEKSPKKKLTDDCSKENDHSPSKQRKVPNEADFKSPPTPATLLTKLDLHSLKDEDKEKKFTPKKLFSTTAVTNIADSPAGKYQNARKALHSSVSAQMPGREKELGELKEFIIGHLHDRSSATLYISGPPGTGKTASLSNILQMPEVKSQMTQVYVNCTGIKSAGAIYTRIVQELGLKSNGKTEKDYLSTIENHLDKCNKKTVLLVLDEIDQLDCKKQSVLYTIFEWPSRPKSHLILIGIANALDLTDRILPRLQSRCELKPKLMHFAPYTKQQIVDIFTDRLKAANVSEVFSASAVQMLAAKVSSVSGDVRRALDIGRRVIELADQHKNGSKQAILKSIENIVDGDGKEEIKAKQQDVKEKAVDLTQVVKVLNKVYGTSQNLIEDAEDDSFPLQQKILVCSLLLLLRKAKNKDVTVGKLHEVYRKVCSKRNILSMDQAEFFGLCSLVETRGIIKVQSRNKEPRMAKISLEWDEGEVEGALRDKQLLSSILQDVSCLGKI